MDRYLKAIDEQLLFNQGKNIFPDNKKRELGFVDETIKAILNLEQINHDHEKLLIDYATDKAIEEFCRMNQYYAFNYEAKNDLRDIYRVLFSSIKARPIDIDKIEKDHYQNLRQWLQKTNPFAAAIYAHTEKEASPVACSEYQADLQIEVLKIDLETLKEPVLDIGCGKQGNLVKYLQNAGIEAYGIDRFSFTNDHLVQSDWLEYNYGIKKWGTITSNLGFSNHFNHHHLRADGNYIEYGKKYMDILYSLKSDGRFHYAPGLPFIEQYLDQGQFKIEYFDMNAYEFKTTIITRQ